MMPVYEAVVYIDADCLEHLHDILESVEMEYDEDSIRET